MQRPMDFFVCDDFFRTAFELVAPLANTRKRPGCELLKQGFPAGICIPLLYNRFSIGSKPRRANDF